MPCDYEIPIKSVGHGITCTDDLLSKDEVRHVLMELSQEVGLKLRKNKLAATRVRISVRDNTLATGIPRKTDISNAELHGNCSGRL